MDNKTTEGIPYRTHSCAMLPIGIIRYPELFNIRVIREVYTIVLYIFESHNQ